MIDWMNPSNDVIDAKRLGYNEGYEEGCREQTARAEDAEQEAATLAGQVTDLQAEVEKLRGLIERVSDGQVRAELGWSEEADNRMMYWGFSQHGPVMGPYPTALEAIEAAEAAGGQA